jgi:pyruvate dehydrogenase E1 component alpha subunit
MEEVAAAQTKEPLARLRAYLQNQAVWDQTKEETLLAECAAQVEMAVEEFKGTTPQPPTAMIDYLYAALPPALVEQRNDILENA